MTTSRLAAVALSLALCACSVPPATVQNLACPAVRDYTAAQQNEIADALAGLPPNSPLLPLERDWQRLRDESRACQGVKP